MYDDNDSMQEYNDHQSEVAEANAREAADYDNEGDDDDHDEGTDGDHPEDHEPDMCDFNEEP